MKEDPLKGGSFLIHFSTIYMELHFSRDQCACQVVRDSSGMGSLKDLIYMQSLFEEFVHFLFLLYKTGSNLLVEDICRITLMTENCDHCTKWER